MVVQDYFTKWVEAIPLQNQTAVRITEELVGICAQFDIPEILHSDQGRAFESTILRQTLEAFGMEKTHTTPYGDGMVERFNRFVTIAKNLCRERRGFGTASCTPITLLSTHLLGCRLLY